MANVYARMTKISDAQGRSNYIGDPKRQENIIFKKKDLEHGWGVVSEFEKQKSHKDKTNWEAREIVVALPNNLSNNLEKLEHVCDDLVKHLVGFDHEQEYAVHWNKDKTNLHVHLLFSERERETWHTPKTYKRDMWYDKNTNRMAKANSNNAELRFKKGERMKDAQGNFRYDYNIFGSKDIKFTEQSFLYTQKYTIQKILKSYGYDLDVQDKTTPFLSQKKLYKGANTDYLQNAKNYNNEVKLYNQAIKDHLKIEPEHLDTYHDMRRVLEKEIKQENRASQSFSIKAIDVVRNIKEYILNLLEGLKKKISQKRDNYEIGEWWDGNKNKIVEMLRENENRKITRERMKNFVETVDKVIDSQEQAIHEMEIKRKEQSTEEVKIRSRERKKNYGTSL